MMNELHKQQLHINFIQTAVLTGLTNIVTGPLQSLIWKVVKDQSGEFLKTQFRHHATGIIKEWLITQLRGKFMDYFTDFIITYIEANIGKIFNGRFISKTAEVIINNIVSGLGTLMLGNK